MRAERDEGVKERRRERRENRRKGKPKWEADKKREVKKRDNVRIWGEGRVRKFEREGEREWEEMRREGWKVREEKGGGERIRPFIHASGDGRRLNLG